MLSQKHYVRHFINGLHSSLKREMRMWDNYDEINQYLDDSLISSAHEDESPDPNDPLKKIPYIHISPQPPC
eukprot:COSAG02_NODE_48576_length_332_cov_10.300429_1_plen_71_part_10